MRKIVILLCLLMMTSGLSGCIGDSEVETTDGDEVILELSDDWPTYYVPTSNDLPTCDSTTQGRLYYVEADANFQACMSTGWQVVEIGGPNANVLLNSAPIVTANFVSSDDDALADDGDGTYSRLVYLSWSAMDLDGTIVSIGLDYDSDGVIDIPFSSNSGMLSDQTPVTSIGGDVYGGSFIIPMEVGNNYIQAENYDDMPCSIMIQKNLMVIAEDDDGAKSYVPMVFDGIAGSAEGYSPVSPLDVQDTYHSAFGIPQSDADWVTGATSSCPSYPTFSLADHADTIGTGTSESIVTVTLDDAGDWSTLLTEQENGWGDDYGYYMSAYCINANGTTWLEGAFSPADYTGLDIENPQTGDTWTAKDSSWSDCDEDTSEVEVRVYFGDDRFTLITSVN
ncbi:YgdI/YgdR family lipoprotein [Candidatus Poseidoniaceae archaeon]|nr:YgdI/YgdR family lipoprotein [Candidatus Poseidoniaceae archaeon]